jgi:hypothetical protein
MNSIPVSNWPDILIFTILAFCIVIIGYACIQAIDWFFIRSFGESFILSNNYSHPFLPDTVLLRFPWKHCLKSKDICYVCAEVIDSYIVLPCRHRVHSRCLQAWICFSMTCPSCRAKIE